jgi:3-oxoacyl-[acyl-carrier protein] reductase
MASVAGTLGGFGQASYAATKASVIGLGKSMALEGARFGITANIIAPGIIGTEAWQMGDAKMNDRMVLRTAMRSAGEPEDIANAIVFLASPEARYITGQVLTVAGGIDLFVY